MRTYYILDHEDPEDAQELNQSRGMGPIERHLDSYAKQAADYCHACRDGWEWSWPKTFVILEDGAEVGRFLVERETVPEFTATRLNVQGMATSPAPQRPAITPELDRG